MRTVRRLAAQRCAAGHAHAAGRAHGTGNAARLRTGSPQRKSKTVARDAAFP